MTRTTGAEVKNGKACNKAYFTPSATVLEPLVPETQQD